MPSSTEASTQIELTYTVIEISHTITFPSNVQNRATLEEKTTFRVLPKQNQALSAKEMIELYSPLLSNFLMLVIWNYVTPLFVHAWHDAKDITKGQSNLYWRTQGMGRTLPDYSNSWLFTLLDINDDLGTIMRTWEKDWEVFQPLIKNYIYPIDILQRTSLKSNFSPSFRD